MGLMRVNRPIIPYFYEVNKIKNGNGLGRAGNPRNPSLFLICF